MIMVVLHMVLAQAVARLKQASIDNPSLDAHLLAGAVLGLDRAALAAQAERVLSAEETAAIESMIVRREKHEPVGRILGRREFWSLDFGLNEATLEPRPDSETLVESVLKHVPKEASLRLLDLGTGTGCLLLSLLHELPHATGIGIDLAPRAVEQAKANAQSLGLGARTMFQTGNWFDGLHEKFDVIIANPPYIPDADIHTLAPDVRDYDPRLALTDGGDGLGAYRILIAQAPHYLAAQGILALEVGRGQSAIVKDMCRAHGLNDVQIYNDLGGVERCVMAWRVG